MSLISTHRSLGGPRNQNFQSQKISLWETVVLKCHAIYCLSKENIYQNYAISNILIDNGRVHIGIFIPVGNFNLLDFFQLNEEKNRQKYP